MMNFPAFMGGVGFQELLLLVFMLLPLIVFLVFRGLFLWYWKVDVIIKNQEQQIALLTRLIHEKNGDAGSKVSSKNN